MLSCCECDSELSAKSRRTIVRQLEVVGFWRFEMKAVNRMVALAFAVALTVSSGPAVTAQSQDPGGTQTRQRVAEKPPQDSAKAPAGKTTPVPSKVDGLEPDETATRPSDVPAKTEANRHEQLSEEAAVVPYYNNFFNTYRLGPEDVISV